MGLDRNGDNHDKLGRYAPKNKSGLTNMSKTLKAYHARERNPEISMSKREWRAWYDEIALIKKDKKVYTRNGKKLIVIGNKIVCTSGTYSDPNADLLLEFDDWDDLARFLKNGK